MKALFKLVVAVIITAMLIFCNNTDVKEGSTVPFRLFVEYSFRAEEEKDFVTGLFQFRINGIENTPSLLRAPATVEMDGEALGVDSAGLSGSFYEIHKPLSAFPGEHTIVLTTATNEKIREKFFFSPFHLSINNDTLLTRDQMLLNFDGLSDGEIVRIVMTDTSFSSNGINEVDTVRNNQVDLRPKLTGNINNGPVVLQILKEEERLIKGTASVGGKISISYSLKREFDLID